MLEKHKLLSSATVSLKNCKTQLTFSCRFAVSSGSHLVSVHSGRNYQEGWKEQGEDPEAC